MWKVFTGWFSCAGSTGGGCGYVAVFFVLRAVALRGPG